MSDHLSWSSESLSPSQGGEVIRLCREFESAWRAGQQPLLETYLGASAERDRSLLVRELVRIELQLRTWAQESPSLTEYRRRFPNDVHAIEAAFRSAPTTDGRPALDLASATLGGSQKQDPEDFVRPDIPGYEVLEPLPLGGMGIVYRARQLEPDRPVALKMIRSGIHADPQELARFRIESEAIASLSHPHIIKIHDWGEWNGLPYIAMEFAENGSLADQLVQGPLTPTEAALVVEKLALATQFIHAQGILHRDLKPANILLAGDGSPKLADFGLAKRLDQDQGLTQTQAVLGTAGYMAPEQAAGNVHALSPAVDIYALGAILYEALTGRPPFRAETREQTIHQVLTEDPQRPTHLRKGVPQPLELICLKCLEKSPADRFSGAAELAEMLGRFRAQESFSMSASILHNRRKRAARRAGYEILHGLGDETECTSFCAKDVSLDRRVVIELLAIDSGSDEEARQALRVRATAAASLHHANIVELYSFGELDGEPFFAREFVDGQGICDGLAPSTRLLEQAALDIEALARAVHYAHLQGLFHGNLKPSKVFRDPKGACKITGFGVGAGATGKESALDVAGDVHCLGAILYQLLTGQPPTEAVRDLQKEKSSRRGSGLEKELKAICQKCLETDPAKRYENAAALAEDLRRARSGEVLLIDDLDDWAQQHRWAERAGFKILELLGQNAFGFTYKAIQTANNRLVVLKRLSARFRFVPAMKERFRFEGRLLAGLRHPNIAAFCDHGEQSDLVYFSREYVDGPSLAQMIDVLQSDARDIQSETPAGAGDRDSRAARLVCALARAVQHLHDKRIVHGGLNPSKIHVASPGFPKITGLGRARSTSAPGDAVFQKDEAFYLAPEQLAGAKRRLETSVDIYALGAILSALLSRRAPSPGNESSHAQAWLQLGRHGEHPGPLIEICRQCLANEPGQRMAAAGLLADALEKFST